MRIAQVAPLYESVPPKCYGGTELVVSYLTEGLLKRGHEVTLFASGDSITGARLYAGCERALRAQKVKDPVAYHVRMLGMIARRAEDFDLIHFHIDYLHYPVMRHLNTKSVTTLHGRLDIPDLVPLHREYQDLKTIAISKSQRSALQCANWVGTVHHGMPTDLFKPNVSQEGKYLAFLGRISPEKGLDRAIEIARRVDMPLLIAAKVDAADQEYFDSKIRPLLDDPLVEYIGEITQREKAEFLGNAHALLFPINWPEPFGMVLIESMAAGTPVIAFDMGSVPEIIEDGVTGYLVESIQEAVHAVHLVRALDRRVVRRVFEERFSVERMCQDYERIYETLTSLPTEQTQAIEIPAITTAILTA
jgi:glycosyltransferase involved in cell wall biosynthesis